MKLQEYLKHKKKKIADMSRDFGVTHCVVRVWVTGERIPSLENMQKIFEYTNGAVTPNDFFNIANDNEPTTPDEVS